MTEVVTIQYFVGNIGDRRRLTVAETLDCIGDQRRLTVSEIGDRRASPAITYEFCRVVATALVKQKLSRVVTVTVAIREAIGDA